MPSRPKLFVGSSQKNLRVASLLAESLKDSAEVKLWNEGVFGLNEGFLETLLRKLEEFDFAAFILAADDVTTSKDEARPSPRDNVLFESGLFMGVLGRERVFLVYDQSAALKIPSDLAGITLASYDGQRIEDADAAEAVRKASGLIAERISAVRFPHLLGEWRSSYPLTFEEGSPMVDEVLEIHPSRDGLSLVTKTSSHDDFYTAFGRVPLERQLIGQWRSRPGANDLEGLFMLTVNPSATCMAGYFTTPDSTGAVVHATWVLAKMTGVDEAKVGERLKRAQELLRATTLGGPSGTSGATIQLDAGPGPQGR